MTDTVFFSPGTLGAYTPEINGADIPRDAVEIPLFDWQALLERLGTSSKKIAADSAGYPILVDPPPLSADEVATAERTWRDTQLDPTDGLIARHRDELESGISTSLTAEQYTELQAYRRQLRDWPQRVEFPLAEHRPASPSWLASLTQ
ncbi:tail fiber assembly protein [Pseudomonas chlororaphis]|uniref:tail fiber assembly protein n=1 Tax=Pseudomonas chlororaphis TaxID=587753 RepID=UPI0003D2CF5E|nr:tail fiber assembly protein [Pseudomonas chlororaphis]ETD36054.1 hypothetical protein U724_25840 [Pseudomonas chlororaphis subsp. aurantiaca PB-St2]QFS53543.1 hypothetical protein FD951_02890 [Pseudomonas chlororaphis subsp. aurantiaca]